MRLFIRLPELQGQLVTAGGCAEEKMPIACHAVGAIGVGQLEIPLIELIFGPIGLKSHPGFFSVSTLAESVSDVLAETTGPNDRLHGSPLS